MKIGAAKLQRTESEGNTRTIGKIDDNQLLSLNLWVVRDLFFLLQIKIFKNNCYYFSDKPERLKWTIIVSD